jgi:dCMP deaminase
MSWDAYFMSIALLSSFRSKDPKTQNGACVVDMDKKIVGIGYNGLPVGLDDTDSQFWRDEDDSDIENSKHTYVVHAERNAIYNSFGRNLKGSTLYCTLYPCANCAQTIAQSGIKRVVYLNVKPHHESENRAVAKMFSGAGVKLDAFSDLNMPDAATVDALLQVKGTMYP